MKTIVANMRAAATLAPTPAVLASASSGVSLASLIPGSLRYLTSMLSMPRPVATDSISLATLGIRD